MLPRPIRRWLPAVAVYAVILALSSVPGDDLAGTPGWAAVVGHATGYALLAAALHRAWGGSGAGLAAVAAAVALGVLNEVQQGSSPDAPPDVADVGVDGLGALAGVYLRDSLSRRRPGSRPPARGSAGPR